MQDRVTPGNSWLGEAQTTAFGFQWADYALWFTLSLWGFSWTEATAIYDGKLISLHFRIISR